MLIRVPVSELITNAKRAFGLNEQLRVAALTTATVILAVAFLALLVSDQVQAADLADLIGGVGFGLSD